MKMPSRLHGKLFNERGFTLIELLIVISIIGVLSVIAIPRFSNAIVLANTAKVQSDLSVINTSITLYQAENGSYPSSIKTDLKDYIVDIDNLKPPKGECLLRDGTKIDVKDSDYTLSGDKTQALCQSHAINEFGRKDK